MPLKDSFASNLKKTRLRKGLTQPTLASKAKISVSYVSMLERAQRSPPLETIENLAGVLGVRPTDLLRA